MKKTNLKDQLISMLLDIAIYNNKTSEVEDLCNSQSSPEETMHYALEKAIEWKLKEMVVYLLPKINKNDYPYFMKMMIEKNDHILLKSFLNQDFKLENSNNILPAVVGKAIFNNNPIILEILHELKFDIHANNDWLLYKSGQFKSLECGLYLFQNKADLSNMAIHHTPLKEDYEWLLNIQKVILEKEDLEQLPEVLNNKKNKINIKL